MQMHMLYEKRGNIMIVDERIVSYINSLNTDSDEIVMAIEEEAIAFGVPIIRRETAEWIKTMLLISRPVNILEVGTAVGYSAIYMSRFIGDDAHITTIEKWEPRIEQAKINFERAKVSDRITLLEGDASDILNGLAKENVNALYLEYDDERIKIAKSGYEKVKEYHNHTVRIAQMLEMAFGE